MNVNLDIQKIVRLDGFNDTVRAHINISFN